MVGAGYESLLTADYSQIEMRIMAHLSRGRAADRGVQVRPGLPLDHRRRGSSTSRPTTVTVEMRAKIKAMNYGLAYGLSAFGLGAAARHRARARRAA